MSKKHTDEDIASIVRVRGFTLIEVLVALAIAGLGLAALVAATGTGLGNAKLADQYVEATRRAESHLAQVGSAVPLEAGERTGDDGGGFSWRLRISPAVAHAAPVGHGPAPPALYTVDVTVSWQSGAAVKSISLQSQRLGPAPQNNG